MTRLLPLAALATTAWLIPAPAAAQENAGDKVNTVIIYGDDACPPSTDGEIVVCARMDEAERYRTPQILRQTTSPANESWTNKVQSYETVGDSGPMSCSPVGAGGEVGCTAQFIEAAYAEKRAGSDVRFSQLIAEERAERLATIDAEAAQTQARVEQIEQEYMARQQREQEAAGEQPTTDVTTPSAPRVVDPLAVPPSE